MFKRLQIRIYPTKEQEILLQKHIDAYRYLYNLCLEYKIHMYKYHKISKYGYDMQSELFSLIKEIEWMKSLKVECLRDAALNVDKSFKNFFKGSRYPRFKSKKDKNSFTANQNILIKNNKLSFFKQKINFRTSKLYEKLLKENKIKKCTFIKEKTEQWFATCLIKDNNIKTISKNSNKVGIDLGLTNFITTSNGDFIENPRHFKKSEKKIKTIQRKHSKSKKGGKNREKLRVKLAKANKKVSNQKQHFFHQVSNKLIFENQEIYMEDLKVANMIKNKKLAKAISESSWRQFRDILEYKCNWYNRKLIFCNTYFASSKTCSNCRNKKEDLKLSDRIYKCSNCNIEIQRDINAAINLVNYTLL